MTSAPSATSSLKLCNKCLQKLGRSFGVATIEEARNHLSVSHVILLTHAIGRIGHRLIVDNNPSHKITSAIIIDIVPTKEQWDVFANPAASAAYYHWPFLATPTAPRMIEAMGHGVWTKMNLERSKGASEAGTAKFREHDAIEHYCYQFTSPESIEGSCGDYAAGAFEDVDEQKKDQAAEKKVSIPLMVIWSASNLGRMHNVPQVWSQWVEKADDVRFEPITDGFGHYLLEECPDRVQPLLVDWIEKYSK